MPWKVWLITGIARGLGRALAEAVLGRGDIVIGTTRNGMPPAELRNENLTVLPLELSSPDQIARAVEAASQAYGCLDVIVNNAGYGLLGPIEVTSPDEVKNIFAVNFFGPLTLIQAVLPILREQRQGHIVNISSIAGIAPAPGSGIYAATKFALEGLSLSLAQEVAPFGIWVTLVEPGALQTEFLSQRSIKRTAVNLDEYAATSGRALDGLLPRPGQPLGDPARAAAAIIEAVEADEPPVNLILGSDALNRAYVRLNRFEQDLAGWESVSVSTNLDV
jgi:NAD(P)-dependent dehydrogenase (short-subunit alcohol dehydrogenase family)